MTDTNSVNTPNTQDKYNAAKDAAHGFSGTLGEKGFALGYTVCQWTYSGLKRDNSDLDDLGMVSTAKFAEFAEVTDDTIAAYRAAYMLAAGLQTTTRTFESGGKSFTIGNFAAVTVPTDLVSGPPDAFKLVKGRDELYSGRSWTKVLKAMRAAKTEKRLENAKATTKTALETAQSLPDGPVKDAAIERLTHEKNLKGSNFGWMHEATEKLAKITESPNNALKSGNSAMDVASVKKSALADLNALITAAESARKAVEDA